eukprot:jgi/Psemu1/10280/gm1.10280_g
MRNHSIPLVAEKELFEWAIKSERLNLFSWTKGNLIKTRASVMKEISATVPEIKGDGFEPHLIDWCSKKSQSADVSGRKQIYVRSFQKALHSLLTNVTLVNEDNLLFPHAEDPTLSVRYPELQGNIDIDKLHHGEWWINTWEKRCKSELNEILSYGTDEFVKNLRLEVTTCFTALTTKVYLVSRIIDSQPRPDFRKTQSTTSLAEKKVRGKKKKSDTLFSDLGSIPHQIDVMVNLFLYELDNGVTGVLGLLTRKQISEQFKDYNMRNKWFNFESLLRNVHDKSGVGSLYGRNVVNYATTKKYMIMYREILVWYMKNVQYPPGSDYRLDDLCFHTKGQNCSPRASKQYVNSMKNFLDCLVAKSLLRVSLSHSYNQVDLDKHFKLQRRSKRIFTTISLHHLDIKLLTHQDFYQYFLSKLFQNSFVLGTTVILGERWVPVGFYRQGDTNIPKTGKVLLPLHSPLVFHYVLNYKDTVSKYYNKHFEINDHRVTLSPCKLGTGKIDLAHFTITKGIIYLVKQWLITKIVDHGTNLGVNVVLSLETASGVLTKTHFAHVNFEDRTEQLVTGNLELSGLEHQHNNQTSVTRFLQYNVFREIFIIDPEAVERHTWVEELIHYSYLPEMRTIFTPLTKKLAGYLLEKSDDLSSANLLVQFLDDNVVNNYGKGTGDLNPAFKHLQGWNFVLHKPPDFEIWDCFKTSKRDIQKFNESHNGYLRGFILPWVLQDHLQDKGANEPPGNISKEAGSDGNKGIVTTKGNSKDVVSTTNRSERGRNNGTKEMQKEVRHWGKPNMKFLVILENNPLRNQGPPKFLNIVGQKISVLLKEPDPEILYPIDKINEQVCYAAGGQVPV